MVFTKEKKFEILEHKADLKIRAFGADKQGLFKNVLLGMQESLRPETKKETLTIKRKIEASSDGLDSLLIDFLSEVNYLNDVKRETYYDFKFKKFSDTELAGELLGRKVERFGLGIKGATYHNLNIRQKKNGFWEATVLFDV